MKYLLLLLVFACSSIQKPIDSVIILDPQPLPTYEIKSSDIVTLASCQYCTDYELKKNQDAVIKVRETLRSQCFKDEWSKKSLIQTNSKTNQEVLDHLLSLNILLKLQMYRKAFSSASGFTYPSDEVIYLNRKFHDKWNACTIGSNLVHEASHKIGYSHDFNPSPTRPQTVPYSLNSVFDKCCQMETK
jgi:hypothetical protein